MDIIGHLTRTVTPAVLGSDNDPAKKSLLEQFYAVFTARLADKETYGRFANENIARNDQAFYDRVWTDGNHRDQISNELSSGHNVDPTAARGLIAMAAPLAYHEIKSLAGTTPVPQFLNDNLSSYQRHIPAWAAGVIPASMLIASPDGEHISDTTSMAPLVATEENSGSFMKALLPIIGLIILGALAWALLRGCQDNPEPVATPIVTEEQVSEEPIAAVSSDIELASLRVATGEGNTLYACNMNVGDEALQNTVMGAMNTTFGAEADKCNADVDDSFATDMPAAAVLADILPIIQSSPNASMIVKGNEIIVNSPDAATLEQLVTDLQAAARNMMVSAEGPLDLQGEIDNSLAAADVAIGRLGENPDPRDVARALSIQVINFELDEAMIPDINKPFLDRAAKLITETPNMQLTITGNTDSLASDAYNLDLSRQRAQAVKEYLVSQGVDDSKLMTKGAGESNPIADNSTEQGRFRNRRIGFTVYNESVDSNGVAVTAGDSNGMANNTTSGNNVTTGTDVNMPDPDLNPLGNDNDDVLPDGDDPTQGTVLDPQ